MKRGNSFTLIELLVVVAIIALLVAMILPALGGAREIARKATCGSNLQQIIKAMQYYAEDHHDLYPLAWIMQRWEDVDDLRYFGTRAGWTRRLFPYIYDNSPGIYDDLRARAIYKCPSFHERDADEFLYFLGARGAFAYRRWQGYSVDMSRVPVKRGLIQFPSAYVMGGDCNRRFDTEDCDRDDYTQECLAWEGNGGNPYWTPFHSGGLNVMFADSHVKFYTRFTPNEMTYSFFDYTTWEGAEPVVTGASR